jgi:hypothetical protein
VAVLLREDAAVAAGQRRVSCGEIMLLIVEPLLSAVQQPAPTPTPSVEDEIVVLARQLGTVRWSYDAEHGVLVRCTIKRSGGAVADALVCEASRQCASENPSVGDRRLAPCIKARVRRLYAERRAAGARLATAP